MEIPFVFYLEGAYDGAEVGSILVQRNWISEEESDFVSALHDALADLGDVAEPQEITLPEPPSKPEPRATAWDRSSN
jgi:hypothetical protein